MSLVLLKVSSCCLLGVLGLYKAPRDNFDSNRLDTDHFDLIIDIYK